MFTPSRIHSGVWIPHNLICQNCLQCIRKSPSQSCKPCDRLTPRPKYTSANTSVQPIGNRFNRPHIRPFSQNRRVQQFHGNSGQAANPTFKTVSSHSALLQSSSPSSLKSHPEAALQDVSSSLPLPSNTSSSNAWELTVGIEIHAELNTRRKLFSHASTAAAAAAAHPISKSTSYSTYESEHANTSTYAKPNTRIAHFDIALPGTQPHFQKETVIPAIRAALALECEVQTQSSFDRKHYFYHDQPCGYQITQFYGT